MTTIEKTRFHDLCEQIIDLCGEMSREALQSNPNLWAETAGMEAVKRAITVAAVARTPVLFIGPNADLAQMLAAQAGVPSMITAMPSQNQYTLQRLHASMKKFPMHVEAPMGVAPKGKFYRGTSLESAKKDIEAARQRMPKTHELTETAARIWYEACRVLSIPELARKSIISVACSCAALNQNAVIDAIDITEAVSYWLDRR